MRRSLKLSLRDTLPLVVPCAVGWNRLSPGEELCELLAPIVK